MGLKLGLLTTFVLFGMHDGEITLVVDGGGSNGGGRVGVVLGVMLGKEVAGEELSAGDSRPSSEKY